MSKSARESQLVKMLKTIGNEDAINILRFAKNGFNGSTDTYEKLGLSVKRYYYRLKSLIDAGLISRKNDRYELTLLGDIVRESIERRVLWAIENMDNLQILETLKKSEIHDKTLEDIVAAVLGNGVLRPEGDTKVIKTYEELVQVTYQLIEKSQEKIYLVSRYSDVRCMEAWWRAMKRGVETWGIDGDIGLLSGRMKALRMVLTHPRLIKAFYELWHSNESRIRFGEVPFSFMIIDGSSACFEILNPAMNGFFAALKLKNKEICDKLLRTFNNLWRDATEDPMKGFSEDLMKEVE